MDELVNRLNHAVRMRKWEGIIFGIPWVGKIDELLAG